MVVFEKSRHDKNIYVSNILLPNSHLSKYIIQKTEDGKWHLKIWDVKVKYYISPTWGVRCDGFYGCQSRKKIEKFLNDHDYKKSTVDKIYPK